MITVNEYFGGNVKSLGYSSTIGKSSVGVIEKGEYEFSTSQHETMIVIEGNVEALLPEQSQWSLYRKGEAFEIEANQSFKVRAEAQVSYLCKYR